MIAALAMTLSALGWGLVVLRLTGGPRLVHGAERPAWALVLGMGMLGWLGFPAGLALGMAPLPLGLVVAGGLPGLLLLRRSDLPTSLPDGLVARVLLVGLLGVAAADLLAATVPPADADSMAYHFGTPKRWLTEGSLRFLPHAIESAAALLLHMTYAEALALGGERGLTLWCGLSAWFLPLTALAIARRHMAVEWALALALAVKTLPAAVYGAPAGQIEVRLAALVLVAVFAAARAGRDANLRPAALAGLAAGFCLATKYSAVMVPALCGLLMLRPGPRIRRSVIFAGAVLLAGGQWYAWNWLHTGDPLFPMLWGKVPYLPGVWDDAMAGNFAAGMSGEMVVPRSIGWLLAYPFKATFDGMAGWESGRTGFGPLAVLLLPFALAGAWIMRRRAVQSELAVALLVCLAGYGVWFLAGASQRVRHFLPYLVPGLIIMVAAATQASQRWRSLRRPLAAAMAVTLLIQAAGLGVFSLKHARWLVNGQSRDGYLAENVPFWPVARRLNETLAPSDKVLTTLREIIYLFDVPAFYAKVDLQSAVHMSPHASDPADVWRELRRQNVTHIVVERLPEGAGPDDFVRQPSGKLALALMRVGCAEPVDRVNTPRDMDSRTLRLSEPGRFDHVVVRLGGPGCRLPT